MKKNSTSIGGQAVIEGVMMRGVKSMATAVRSPEGNILIESKRLKVKSSRLRKIPILRGIINFIAMLFAGTGTLLRSAEVFGQEEPGRLEKWMARKLKVDLYSVIIFIAVVLGLGLAVFLFSVLPTLITSFIVDVFSFEIDGIVLSAVEGVLKFLIFILYILLSRIMKDVRRTYMYHGAEHRTISCYEHGEEITVENVQKYTTVHDRCGTTFMFLVLTISIIAFAFVSWDNTLYRVLIKLAFLPLIAGISYEVLKFLAKWDNLFIKILKAPGLLLQKLTTGKPDDKMAEVAVTAFKTVMAMDADETIPEVSFNINKPYSMARINVENYISKVKGADIKSEADWIFCKVLNIERSALPLQKYVSEGQYKEAVDIAKQRSKGKPLQYILGSTEFYGCKIKVDERVLIPRFETELLAEQAIKSVKRKIPDEQEKIKILDLCTGSGAIAVAISRAMQQFVSVADLPVSVEITASDISAGALEIAKENAELNNADIEFVQSDMFEAVRGKFDVIVSNPPYIPEKDIRKLAKTIKEHEPESALNGGKDGLAYYRIIAEQAGRFLNKNGIILLETGIGQAKETARLFINKKVEIVIDYNGIERILKIQN